MATVSREEQKANYAKRKKISKYVGSIAGVLAFGISWKVLGALWGGFGFIGAMVIGSSVSKIAKVMFEGVDTTTHNKEDLEKELPPLEEVKKTSGDDNADAIIAKGQEMLQQIHLENARLPDRLLTLGINEVESICVQIFKTIQEHPAKVSQIRKFMNYYLPTTLKILTNYRIMTERHLSESTLQRAYAETLRGLDMIRTACQKQLDNLYEESSLDISTDIDVLEQMLKRDGFTDGEFSGIETPAPDPMAAGRTSIPDIRKAEHPQRAAQPQPAVYKEARQPVQAQRPIIEIDRRPEEKRYTPVPVMEPIGTAATQQMNSGAPILEVPSSPTAPDADEVVKQYHYSNR